MAAVVPYIPYAMAGASAVSGIASYQSSQYQAAVLQNNANTVAMNAEREQHAANLDMQDKDISARAQIANLMAEMDASGLTATSGSMLSRRASMETLAARDRERLGQKRDIQFENSKREEASLRSEAKAAKKMGKLGLLSTMLSVPTSWLSGASMVNQYTQGRMGLTNPG